MAVNIPFPLPATGFALNSKVRVNLDFLVAQFNEFNSGTATWDNVSIGTANSLTGTLTFYNASNANYLTFKAGATGSNTTYTFPTSAPVGQGLLKSTSAGVMSFLEGTGILYGASSSYGFSGVASVANALPLVSTAGVVSIADHSYNVTAASNGLLYIASGVEVIPLANTLGSTGILIGASSGTPKYVSLLGTTNQITVTPNVNDLTLSTPQNLDTSANFQVASLRTAAGSAANCAVRLNAANTGIYMQSSTIMDFVIAGTAYAELDNTGAWFTTGEHRGTVIRATSSWKVSTGAGSIVTIQALGSAFGDYTLTLPPDDGTADYVLRTNGSGVLTWVSVASAGGANTALSNLASVAINTALLPASDNSIDLGSGSKRWAGIDVVTLRATGQSTLITASGEAKLTIEASAASQNATLALRANHATSGLNQIYFGDAGDATVGRFSYDHSTNTLSAEANNVNIFSGTSAGFTIRGTNTNNSAAAGYVGETASGSQTSNTNFPASGQLGDLTSVSLTAGHWEVSAVIYATLAGSTTTEFRIGISTTSGNDSTGLTLGDNYVSALPPVGTADTGQTMPSVQFKLSGTTTVYLKYIAFFVAGNPQARGTIRAIRVR